MIKSPSLWRRTNRPNRSAYSREKTLGPGPLGVRPYSIRRSSFSTSICFSGTARPA
ncbi:Uncharacterised protein [Mycobacteroides abscessus subsp. abscessus]|nr:Uncharacterised protein [Mycobacteroides abscessus subsp. abscessus]